jgi:hypothetical protein
LFSLDTGSGGTFLPFGELLPVTLLHQALSVILHAGAMQDQFLFVKRILSEEQPFLNKMHGAALVQREMVLEELVRKNEGDLLQHGRITALHGEGSIPYPSGS